MLNIGSLQLDFPVVQAALAGYSDAPMRLIARQHGAPYALQEVMLDKLIVQSGRVRARLLGRLDPQDHPIGGQLLGARPREFAEAALLMVGAGYEVIDINFACPVKKVLGRRRGGFLLSDPNMAIEIMRGVRSAVPPYVPVTVKMRRGLDDTPESERKFYRILEAAFELGLSAVTLHPRTVIQRYRGRADRDFLARVKRHAGDRTVLGSGDLFTGQDVKRMLEHTGVDGVTVARGCIGNPWIFDEAQAALSEKPLPKPPSVLEQGRVIRHHYELAQTAHGERLGARIMRKFGIKYAELHPYAQDVRAAFVRVRDRAQWLAVLEEWYDPHRDWPPGQRKQPPV